MGELSASGLKFAFYPSYDNYYQIGDETEVSKIHRNRVNCQLNKECIEWAMYHKNVSFFLDEYDAEFFYALGYFVGENSKPLVCKLEDGVIIAYTKTMLMFPGDPLMRRINVIIDRVVEAGIYNHWVILHLSLMKAKFQDIAIVNEYYSFNLYHMQTTFYLLFMGWCLSALCFLVEVLYKRILSIII
jgi:hypothetical protein